MPHCPRHIAHIARRLAGLWLVAALLWPIQAAALTVFAAASLKTALEEIAAAYEAETGTSVTLSFAGSSALARQIAQGAPADVFLSANAAWMDDLAGRRLLAPGSRHELLSNRLVLIAHGDVSPFNLADLPARLGDDHLAMALVDAVPAGIYGKAALENLGLWPALEPHVAQADNVRAALALVALGAAPYGITYLTDAAAEPRVSIVARFPVDSHPPITYPAAAIASGDTEAAASFVAFLRGPAARAAFARQGFALLPEDGE